MARTALRTPIFSREHVEEERQARRVHLWVLRGVFGRTHREAQLRVRCVSAGIENASASRAAVPPLVVSSAAISSPTPGASESAQRAAGRSGRSANADPPAASGACRRERPRAPGSESVYGQGADIGVLNEVAPNARCEVRAVDERTPDGRLREPERAAHLTDETARVLFVRGREQRPERGGTPSTAVRTRPASVGSTAGKLAGASSRSSASRVGTTTRGCSRPPTLRAPSFAHAANQSARSGCVGATRTASRWRPRWSTHGKENRVEREHLAQVRERALGVGLRNGLGTARDRSADSSRQASA